MKTTRKKVIITGGTGLLATNIALYKRDHWDILLLTRNHTLIFEGVTTRKANLLDLESLDRLFNSFEPSIVIHTAGLTNVEECEKNYYGAHLANTVVAKNIANLCQRHQAQLIHISTDHFSNEKLEYSSETDISLPVNVYAATKLQGEVEVKRNCPSALIIRTNFFGWGHLSRASFTDFIIDNLRKNNPITLFEDVIFTPVFIDDLVDSLLSLTEKKVTGVFNIVTNKAISKYEFGLRVADIFQLDTAFIEKGSIKSRKMTPRPLNMALSNYKLVTTLGKDFNFDLNSSLQRLKTAEFEGRRKKLIGSFEDQKVDLKEQIIYGKQYIDEADVNSVISTLLSTHLTQGPKVEEFEEKVAHYTGAKYAVAFANLTCGLHAAYLAAGFGPGDFIITSPITFVATSNAALYCGATPIFADIHPDTLNLDLIRVEQLLQKFPGKVKGIIAVHFGGHPCDMDKLNQLAAKYNVTILEDAAHALGGEYPNGEKIGNGKHSLIAGFSFHPVKNVTTGEGAVMTTNDPEVYKSLCRLRSHGITKGNDPFLNKDLAYTEGLKNPWYYEMQNLGYNYRLTDIQSALGISQMAKLDMMMKRRREIAAVYDQEFSKNPLVTVLQRETRNLSGNHLYTLKIDYKKLGTSRLSLFQMFSAQGVHLHVHYIPVHLQPFYRSLECNNIGDQCVNAISYYESAATLPLHPLLTDKNVELIVELTKNLIK